MKNYRVIISYSGAIDVEVEAEDPDDARKIAEDKADNMTNEAFLLALEPQPAGMEVEEI